MVGVMRGWSGWFVVASAAAFVIASGCGGRSREERSRASAAGSGGDDAAAEGGTSGGAQAGSGGRAGSGTDAGASAGASVGGSSVGGSGGAALGGKGGTAGAPACECGEGSGEFEDACATEVDAFCIRGQDYPPNVGELSCPLVVEELLQGGWTCSEWGPWNYSECDDGTMRISWLGEYGETRYELVFDTGGSLVYGLGEGYVSERTCSEADVPARVTAGRLPSESVACRTCSRCGGLVDDLGVGGAPPDVERCAVDAEGRISLPR